MAKGKGSKAADKARRSIYKAEQRDLMNKARRLRRYVAKHENDKPAVEAYAKIPPNIMGKMLRRLDEARIASAT